MVCDSDELYGCDGACGKRTFPFGETSSDREIKRVAADVCMNDEPWQLASRRGHGSQDADGRIGELAGELPQVNLLVIISTRPATVLI